MRCDGEESRSGSRAGAEMAPTRGRLKGIYPERKKGARTTTTNTKRKPKKGKSQPQCQGDADADSGGGGYTGEEEELRQFDLDMTYGPCIGVTRLRRWHRAAAMGLRPPPHLRDLILLLQQQHGVVVGSSSSPPPKSISKSDGRNYGDTAAQLVECLWAGKV